MMRTSLKEGVIDAKSLRLSHTPGSQILSTDPVAVFRGAFQNKNFEAVPRQNNGQRATANTRADYNYISLCAHLRAPCLLRHCFRRTDYWQSDAPPERRFGSMNLHDGVSCRPDAPTVCDATSRTPS